MRVTTFVKIIFAKQSIMLLSCRVFSSKGICLPEFLFPVLLNTDIVS